ncbi:MAG: flagellar biosynthesis protein FlgJ [Sphingomonadales bacterium]|nr:MAG: flagellar biosynthesis protein FlgJ [Sphingomonadales bacterium]
MNELSVAFLRSPTPTGSAALNSDYSGLDIRTKLKSAARDFEGVLIGQLTNVLFRSAPVSETFGGGQAEETFRSLLGDEVGKSIARRGGIGLAPAVLDQLLKLQGLPPETTPASVRSPLVQRGAVQ